MLIILALVIGSPAGAFASLVLAVVCSAIASQRVRLVSAALLVVSIILAATFYPAFERDRGAYMRRAKMPPSAALKVEGIDMTPPWLATPDRRFSPSALGAGDRRHQA